MIVALIYEGVKLQIGETLGFFFNFLCLFTTKIMASKKFLFSFAPLQINRPLKIILRMKTILKEHSRPLHPPPPPPTPFLKQKKKQTKDKKKKNKEFFKIYKK